MSRIVPSKTYAFNVSWLMCNIHKKVYTSKVPVGSFNPDWANVLEGMRGGLN